MTSNNFFRNTVLTRGWLSGFRYLPNLELVALPPVKDILMSMFNMALSREELEILVCAAEEKNLAGISLNLFIFENTVSCY